MISLRGHLKGDLLKAPVRDVGGAFPRRLTSCRVHGAHRLGIHAADGDDTPVRARRAATLPLYAVPALSDLPPPSGRPLGMQVTRSQEGPNHAHGKSPAATATGRVLQHAEPWYRASDVRRGKKARKPLSMPTRAWPRNGLLILKGESMAKDTIELKPCPFCGEKHDMAITFSTTLLPKHKDGRYFSVRITCRNCWASVHGYDSFEETEAYQSAVLKWNRRCEK